MGMTLVELTAYWPGDYSKDDVETYSLLHGEDRSKWPVTENFSPVTIDIEKTIRFNPAYNDKYITLDLCGGNSITIAIAFKEYSLLLNQFGIAIYKYDGVSNHNKPV